MFTSPLILSEDLKTNDNMVICQQDYKEIKSFKDTLDTCNLSDEMIDDNGIEVLNPYDSNDAAVEDILNQIYKDSLQQFNELEQDGISSENIMIKISGLSDAQVLPESDVIEDIELEVCTLRDRFLGYQNIIKMINSLEDQNDNENKSNNENISNKMMNKVKENEHHNMMLFAKTESEDEKKDNQAYTRIQPEILNDDVDIPQHTKNTITEIDNKLSNKIKDQNLYQINSEIPNEIGTQGDQRNKSNNKEVGKNIKIARSDELSDTNKSLEDNKILKIPDGNDATNKSLEDNKILKIPDGNDATKTENKKETINFNLSSASTNNSRFEHNSEIGILNKDEINDSKVIKENLFKQIVDKAIYQIQNKNAEMKIKLKPDFLGNLQIKVATDNQNQIMIKILAEFPFVKEIIDNNFAILKTELQNQGLNIDKFEVFLSQEDNSNHEGYAKNLLENNQKKKEYSGMMQEENKNEHTENEHTSSSNIDYFA